ncbi:hypothetical protein G6O67_005580 [Ophiocordyceps sinensis]|uniref:Uncharacterized protein n=1 Tax=Ophiocordyceps sinensis TaxID=72228 RepID=A0A8H4V6C8_9HYPO|nr:hypothetical protein G6O67_005580 [Ophiocordyceps sinensis]
MNSVAVYRQSVMPADYNHRENGNRANLRRANLRRDDLRRRTFTPVDWPSFKRGCELQRASSPVVDDDELSVSDLEPEPEPEKPGFLEGLKRIFTVYPYRDAQWVVAVLFFVGSLSFTIRAFFILVPIATALEDGMEAGFPAITIIGAVILFLSNSLTMIAAFNVNRGHPAAEKGQPPPTQYCPALLGSEEWTWWPSFAEFTSVFLPNAAFRAGLVAILGGLILVTSAIAGLPGVLGDRSAPGFAVQYQSFVIVPQIAGGAIVAVGALRLTSLTQTRWYKACRLLACLACLVLDRGWRPSCNAFWSL